MEAFMTSIREIYGIKKEVADVLHDEGVSTTDHLLSVGSTVSDRFRLADEMKLSSDAVEHLVNQADLLRVDGVGPAYAALLCGVGVCTVPKLAYRNPRSLLDELVSYNEEHSIVEQLPSLAGVASFIAHAKELPKIIRH